MAIRTNCVLTRGVVMVTATLLWQMGVPSSESRERTSRTYQGYHCPYDPHELTSTTYEQRIKPLHPYERRACALQLMYEEDNQIRTVALRILEESFPDLAPAIGEVAIQLVSKEDGEGRQPPSDEVVAKLVRRISEALRSGADKRSAVQLLGLLGCPDAVGILGESLEDPDPNVRRDVVDALREVHSPNTLDLLMRAARGRDPFIGTEAVPGVAAIGGPRARDALIEIMDDRKLAATVRLSAARELRVTGDPKAVAAAERHLASLRPQWHRAFY